MNNGDFIKIDYEMMVGDDKKIVSTNNRKLAEDNGIYDEHLKYGEFVAIVGSDSFFKAINESFLQAETGKEYVVEVKPEDGFGVREPRNLKVHTIREFQRQNIDPEVGQEIMIKERRGRIVSVTPGRVMVDYNHRYAGKTVYYKYKLLDVVSDNLDKVKAIVSMNYHADVSKFSFEMKDDVLTMQVPDDSKFDPAWFEAKFTIVNEVRKYIPGVSIVFQETYAKQEKPAEEKPDETSGKTEDTPAEKTES